MSMNLKSNRMWALIITLIFALGCILPAGLPVSAADADMPVLTFSDAGIAETAAGSGYSISGTTLTISSAGVYKITGSCAEGNIVVKGSLSDVVLLLDDLTLKSSSTAPIVIKKKCSAAIHTSGSVSLYDNEDPANETSADAAVADDFEGAGIKAKSGSTVTFCGGGTLNVYGNAKNGIKGAAGSELVFADSNLSCHVTSKNNGIAADGSITIYDGKFSVESENDGIKSVPDETDADSSGTITIYDGTFDIHAEGDGFQAETDLAISGGTFTINTFRGYDVSGTKYWNAVNRKNKDAAGEFDGSTMSSKGLNLSGDRGMENEIYITGGSFAFNTSDDAIHSDKKTVITGGSFTIDSGEDGIHADAALTLGTENGLDRDPDITISHSYEGLEAANVYIFSGRARIEAADDGINAAGGSDGSSSGFTPWGPGHGGHSSNSYSVEVSGGHLYVNCLGDGMDSNGALKLTGGETTVFSKAANGDDSPLDADGTVTINGAAVFTAGSAGVNGNLRSNCFGQNYYQTKQSVSANTVVNVYDSSSQLLYSDQLPRTISYWMYSSPSLSSSSASLRTGGSVNTCKSHDWNHNWGELTVVTAAKESASGTGRYTCADCGAAEDVTLLFDKTTACDGHGAAVVTDPGFKVDFVCDEGVAGIDVYHTQDYTSADEKDAVSTVSRDSDSGDPCSTGNGQINFLVRLKDGCSISEVSAVSGTYKNIKGPDDTGQDNTYRITKISADTTVTITTTICAEGHTLTHIDAKEADCTENGCIEHWLCSVCGRCFADGEAVEEISAESTVIAANCPSAAFKDVDTGQWFHKSVDYAVKNGLMYGVSKDRFDPDGTTTRAMIVAILYRLEGKPAVSGSEVFDDVKSGHWYSDAIAWAAANKIVNGYGDGIFGPDNTITREQFAAILFRYAQFKGYDVSAAADLSSFDDAASVSDWAGKSMEWAFASGLIKGRTETELVPGGDASRAESAAILKRFIENNTVQTVLE